MNLATLDSSASRAFETYGPATAEDESDFEETPLEVVGTTFLDDAAVKAKIEGVANQGKAG